MASGTTHTVVAALAVLAAAVAVPAAAQQPTLALVGGRILDGYGGPPIEDGVILIAGERITAVGRRGDVPVPQGARVVSTEGMSVLPGLMDMHVHLMIVGHADYQHWDTTYQRRFRAEIMPAAAKQLLLAGVTTARDVGAPLEDIVDVKRRIERGEIPGPRLFVTGPFQHEPYAPYEARFRWGVKGADDARLLRKEQDLGTLAPGRYADIIAVKGDVLRDIELLARPDIVIKGGVRIR